MMTSRIKTIERKINPDNSGTLLVLFQDEAGHLMDRAGQPVKDDALAGYGAVIIFGSSLAGI